MPNSGTPWSETDLADLKNALADAREIGHPLLNIADGGDQPGSAHNKRLHQLKRNLAQEVCRQIRRGKLNPAHVARWEKRPDVFGFLLKKIPHETRSALQIQSGNSQGDLFSYC